MKFKPHLDKTDFFRLHPKLIEIVGVFLDHCLTEYNLEPAISSMLRLREWDTGVHETGRAIDFSRHELDFGTISPSGAARVLASVPEADCGKIVHMINAVYVRTDGHDTAKWHDAGKGPHFHFQVESTENWKVKENENILLCKKRKPELT